MVKITNYPNSGSPIYNPKGREEYFRITPNGLEPTLLKNVIIFSNDKMEEMMRVQFDVGSMKFIATATDKTDNTKESTTTLFNIRVKDLTVGEAIGFKQTAAFVASRINGTSFVFGGPDYLDNDKINIRYYYDRNNQITVTNYPKDGENFTPPAVATGLGQIKFQITPTGLQKR